MQEALNIIQRNIAEKEKELHQLRMAEAAIKGETMPPGPSRAKFNVNPGEFTKMRIGQSLESYLNRIDSPIDFSEAEEVLSIGGCPQYPEQEKGGSIRKSIALYPKLKILGEKIYLTTMLTRGQLADWEQGRLNKRQQSPHQSRRKQ